MLCREEAALGEDPEPPKYRAWEAILSRSLAFLGELGTGLMRSSDRESRTCAAQGVIAL